MAKRNKAQPAAPRGGARPAGKPAKTPQPGNQNQAPKKKQPQKKTPAS